jgi:hypothetical protein
LRLSSSAQPGGRTTPSPVNPAGKTRTVAQWLIAIFYIAVQVREEALALSDS